MSLRVRWNDVYIFLCVAEAGSIRTGAIVAGVATNTCRAAIARLEYVYGACIFIRCVSGIELTREGQELFGVARKMRELLSVTYDNPAHLPSLGTLTPR
jgi:DNA-binding transcriptional LysR family regulator